MVAGHTLMHLLTSFFAVCLKLEFLKDKFFIMGFVLFSILPFLFFLFIFILEFGIAFLQSYVFLVLTSMYLNDVLSDPLAH
jgi:F0F1-type ATP synthase membrane subunit a